MAAGRQDPAPSAARCSQSGPERGVHPLQATPLQVGIQCGEALEGRDGHQEVPAHEAHHPLDPSLVIAFGGTAEPVIEQVMGLQLGESTAALAPTVSKYPGHRQPGIVVQDALGHSAQERDG